MPGRIWSLWELNEFVGDEFLIAANAMASMRAAVREFKSTIENSDGSVTFRPISDPVVLGMIRDNAVSMSASCRELHARITLIALDEFRVFLNNPDSLLTFEALEDHLKGISDTLRREMKAVTLLAVDPQDQEMYAPSSPLFGSDFEVKFGSAAYDVEEAAKCLALGRTTASAYHSLRALEAGVYAMSRSLGIPDPTKGAKRSWAAMLKLISEEMERRWPASSGRMSGDAQTFDEVYGAIAGMQNPYRNSTMHLADKYTADEARHIFELVKGLMKRLVRRMDENGLPLAG